MAVYRGDLFAVLDKLCDSRDEGVFNVCDELLRLGLVHPFDVFEGFKDFQSGRRVIRAVGHIDAPLLRDHSRQEPNTLKSTPASSGGTGIRSGSEDQELRLDISLHK